MDRDVEGYELPGDAPGVLPRPAEKIRLHRIQTGIIPLSSFTAIRALYIEWRQQG